jgi:hypothetical protein
MALALAGCAAVKYDLGDLDNPWPGAQPPVACRAGNEALAVGHECVALVRARDWYSDTRLQVGPNQAYCVEALPNQQWFDAGRVNTPPRGEPGSFLMNLYASGKRYPQAGWFSLIVGVVDTSRPTEKRLGHEVLVDDPQLESASLEQLDRCGTLGNVFRPQTSGFLVLYPNDAVLDGAAREHFYKNNAGQIWVTVTRMADRVGP